MTNETKHTPGPWIVTDQAPIDGLDLRGLKSVAHASDTAAGAIHTTVCEIVSEADAELIARAPSLLAENESLRQQNAELVRALRMVADAQRSGNYGEAFNTVNAILADVQS